MKKVISLTVLLFCISLQFLHAQDIKYVDKFVNENHPEIGYWFISPDLLEHEEYLKNLDTIARECPYTMLFLTARGGVSFYDYKLMHPVFSNIVKKAHQYGLKVGLQVWGNYNYVPIKESDRMVVGDEVTLDNNGNASFTSRSRYIRFPDRLIKCGLLKVYAFKKTSDGFYDPSTLKDITGKCKTSSPDKTTLDVTIEGGSALKGLTAYIMMQQYCTQSSNFGKEEIGRFAEAINVYGDIPFDGFALDEYGNKFVARSVELGPNVPFRGQWYSIAMANAFKNEKGLSLEKTLFDTRYAPQGKPEARMKAINYYMDFMRSGALRVETAVYKKSREVFGKDIFSGIHDTYHNSLVNDEIWANGIPWWKVPREYGQTDERTSLPVQMGVAMSHSNKHVMYNQYYNRIFPPVQEKALTDLRYGVRTHYHALHDKRENRFDLQMPEAIEGVNKVENCARLLNKINPLLPDVRLLVVFGVEALQNWYPNETDRGTYDINDKLEMEEKAKAIWDAGYLNAFVPSDLIVSGQLKIGKDGKPVMNGHVFDAVVYLYPQYAREQELKFIEEYLNKGGKLMLAGNATRDFNAKDITKRFRAIQDKATVKDYSIDALPQLGLQKNGLPDGCKSKDGFYVYTDINSLRSGDAASFSVEIDGDTYSGDYRGLSVIAADRKNGIRKFAAAGFTNLKLNGNTILEFREPVDVFVEKAAGKYVITVQDRSKSISPSINKL